MGIEVIRSFIEQTTDVQGTGTQLCEDARTRRAEAAANYHRYENLVYALTAAAAIALIIAIGLIVLGRPNEGIATGVASVLSGGAAVFILTRRNEAKKAESDAWREVKRECRVELQKQDEAARLALGLAEE
jgi:hypothetical protein